MLPLSKITATFFVLLMCSLTTFAQANEQNTASPLRLSYAEGDISFWRVGAAEWVTAQLNTPLAIGDALYVDSDADLELQMGSRAFVRADDDTQFSLVNQTPDFIQFKVTSGRVSFDLRALPTGYSVEVDTPNAVFTIDHVGYYRVDVDGDVRFITRRGGMAMLVPAGGQAMSIHPSEEIVVHGTTVAQAETYVVPILDQWDRWNYDRTDGLIDTVSERYLPYGIAGTSDLDHYGDWRVVPDYGPVWVPDTLPSGWVPYSAGRWWWDPYYQWTWIDDAPWGWAPFHYGRWVYLGGYWAWAPGPVIRRPVYAPALVAFFNVDPRVSVGIGSSGVGWVALSWGEPVNPWWGQRGFVGRPWWGGWGGPRVVNNVVVRNNTAVNVTNINYHNTRVNNAIVATTYKHFGHGHVDDAPVHVKRPQELEHIRGALPVRPGAESLVGGAQMGIRPPESMLSRPVVGTRPPQVSKLPWRVKTPKSETKTAAEQRYLPRPKRLSNELARPEFGAQTGAERPRPPLPPRFEERRHSAEPAVPGSAIREPSETNQPEFGASSTTPPDTPPQSMIRDSAPPRAVQDRGRLSPESRRGQAASAATPRAALVETRQQKRADLPGKPANRVFRFKDKNKNKEKEDQQLSQQPDGLKKPKRDQ